jgi:hypothetical protein
MRLPRLAATTAAAAAAGLAAFAAAPSAHAAAHPGGSAAATPAVISSVPMLPGAGPDAGAGAAQDGEPEVPPGPGSGWWPEHRPGPPGAPRVWLKLSLGGPMFGDDYNEMYYSLTVVNSRFSPDTATGLVVRTTMLECTRKDEPDAFCAHARPFYERIGALAPGQAYNGSLPVALPNNDPTLYLRLTAALVHVDELTPGATPGICSHGLHPSDLCASTDYTLLP